MRAEKSAKYSFRIIYFTAAVIWGWSILLSQPYMPPALGGTGDLRLIWANFPYQEHAP
jgi:hypothetical protein